MVRHDVHGDDAQDVHVVPLCAVEARMGAQSNHSREGVMQTGRNPQKTDSCKDEQGRASKNTQYECKLEKQAGEPFDPRAQAGGRANIET
eukprot:CAMPEP_0119288504 /NCGR_PEP_ID=MMETSP1329-20130426/37387_1 /TAXON_ID=114041 /ORGANISM="Genus nov. species nov., Strain RCC1024" /LENGTH=89 /DNA_ID=CAMNT_0007289285 /DNA_START=120 /DNA_END=390 /DNA_ORIENTATION=-